MMWEARDCGPSYRVYHDIIRALAATRILNVELLREKPSHPSSGQRTREAPSLPPLRARPDRSLAHLSAIHSFEKSCPHEDSIARGKRFPIFSPRAQVTGTPHQADPNRSPARATGRRGSRDERESGRTLPSGVPVPRLPACNIHAQGTVRPRDCARSPCAPCRIQSPRGGKEPGLPIPTYHRVEGDPSKSCAARPRRDLRALPRGLESSRGSHVGSSKGPRTQWEARDRESRPKLM